MAVTQLDKGNSFRALHQGTRWAPEADSTAQELNVGGSPVTHRLDPDAIGHDEDW
jgi:hypothetical protein